MADSLTDYYARRAHEYDAIYARPERQRDLAQLRNLVSDFGRGAKVLEIACGTGYWTEVIAPFAREMVATDFNQEVLEIAKSRAHAGKRTTWVQADAYQLPPDLRGFDACIAAFWWSHVPLERLRSFLDQLHGRLNPGARVLFIDNRWVEGSSTPILRTDSLGNTYQRRSLSDGTQFEVLKNFPSPQALRDAAGAGGCQPNVRELEYFWLLDYRIPDS